MIDKIIWGELAVLIQIWSVIQKLGRIRVNDISRLFCGFSSLKSLPDILK